jgi:hypothetical protein
MEALARRHGADLAMLYPHWFGPARPASWVPLATLHLDRVSPFIAGEAVALHATRAEAVAPLTDALVAFTRGLPEGTRLVWEPGIGPAALPR